MPPDNCCAVCGRRVPPGYRFRGGALRCGRHALRYRPMLRRSLLTALLVGTLLTGINQGNLILHHGFTAEIVLKMGLTFCVPFAVSTSGALGAARIERLVPRSAESLE